MASSGHQSVIHVTDTETGETLLRVIRNRMPELSWGAAKKLLNSRQVSVNGAMCLDEGRRVKAGDVVHVFEHPRTPQPTAADVKLLYWDEDVAVIVKPALMTTLRHAEERNWPAARKNLQPTLDEVLPELLRRADSGEDLNSRGGGHQHRRGRDSPKHPDRRGQNRGRLPRVRAVHRLDRDTSGVMVFARNEHSERHLIEQFKVHSIERRYLAVVQGHPEAQTIRLRLIRDRGDGLRGVTDSPTDGEDAVTHVRPKERLGDYSLVECRLETGRTHQIRLHMAAIGHLVCGDPLYIRMLEGASIDDSSGAPRLALHARFLEFEHPRMRERMDFEADLPDDLQKFVRRLRKAAGAEPRRDR